MEHGKKTAAADARPPDRSGPLQVNRLVAGDTDAFDDLVRTRRETVARLVGRLLGWTSDVPDVVQDVFVSALSGIGRFRGDSSVDTWLTRIAINTCRKHQRRRLVRWIAWRRQAEEPACVGTAGPDSAAMGRETFEQVRRAVRNLPPRYREVVVLRYLEDLPITEVAELLGLSRNAVDVRLNRARSRLKDALAPLLED
jgi:RNA polymerase sigma factor (sigma-70 family)